MNTKAFVVTVVGSVVLAYYHVLTKDTLRHWKGREAIFTALVAMTAGSTLIMWGVAVEGGVDRGAWLWPLCATGVLNIGILYLNVLAKSLADASLVVPIAATTPTVVIVTSFFILGERVTPIGAVGIMLTAVGSYILNLEGYLSKRGEEAVGWRGLLAPILLLGKNRGVQCALAAACLAGISLNYDGLVARRAPSIGIGFGLVFLITALGNLFTATARREWSKAPARGVHLTPVLATGIVYALAIWFVSAPFQWALVPYVGTLKRLQIPITVILAFLILKEGKDASGHAIVFKARLIGGTTMAVGAVLIGLA